MDNRQAIINAATELLESNADPEKITVREICGRAGAALGLINYYFGNKERLMEICVEKIINGVVKKFGEISNSKHALSPAEKLGYLGNLTFTFLFEHAGVSKISMLSDMRNPKPDDNTARTCSAFIPLVAECRPDLTEAEVKRKTFALISAMQGAFLRSEIILAEQGVNLKDAAQRERFHSMIINDILGVTV